MLRTFTLLLSLLLFTCVRAQTVEPESLLSPGTLMVIFGDGEWRVEIASAEEFEVREYVTGERARRFPNRYRNHEQIRGSNRYDLRMIHRLVLELQQRGWKLTGTDYSQSTRRSESIAVSEVHRERLLYHFMVPVRRSVLPQPTTTAEVLLGAEVDPRNQQRLRGQLVRNTDGTRSLVIEKLTNRGWGETYRLHDAGPLASDVADRIRSIRLSDDQLSIGVELANGKYRYTFRESTNQGYYLAGGRYQSGQDCGLLEYTFTMLQTSDAQINGFRRAADCRGSEPAIPFVESRPLSRTWLQDFNPGSYRIELEEPVGTLIF